MKQKAPAKEEVSAPDSLRERILSAAFDAFTEHGFARASTLDIATRAKVSKRELYALFGDKRQMLIACVSDRARRMRVETDRPVVRSLHDFEITLIGFGSALLREITDPHVIAVYRLAISEAARSPEVAEVLETYGRKQAQSALREILLEGASAGLLPDTDPDRLVGEFMALLVQGSVMNLALGLGKRPSAGEAQRRAVEATGAFLKLHPGDNPQVVATPAGSARREIRAR